LRKALMIVVVLIMLIPVVACSQPSFEEQRTSVVEYLLALNKIDNDLYKVSSQIIVQGEMSNLLQINNALNQVLIAANAAMQRASSIKPPDIDDAKKHLQDYKQLVEETLKTFKNLQSAISTGNQADVTKAAADLTTMSQHSSSFYRSTEALMLKYNITDSEVNYKYRGM
jgi:hypothetical protein